MRPRPLTRMRRAWGTPGTFVVTMPGVGHARYGIGGEAARPLSTSTSFLLSLSKPHFLSKRWGGVGYLSNYPLAFG